MDFVNEDGGKLPVGGSISPPSNMLAGFSSRPVAERKAFKRAIAPKHWTVTDESLVVELEGAMPGDTASKSGVTTAIYLLTAADSTLRASWINMLTNTQPPAIS